MNSRKEILPSIKKICTQEQQLSFSKGKTYEKNGLILKHKITRQKIKNLVEIFAHKIRRNSIYAPPVNFELDHPDKQNQNRLIKLKGFNIEDNFEGLMLFLDIVMSLVTFVIATYQGLLDNFREQDAVSTPIIVLKGISLAVFSIRLIMALITIDYVEDTLYVYIIDIIGKQLKDGSILLHIFSLIMNIISLCLPRDNAVGIIFFCASLAKMYLIRSNIRILELLFINSMRKYYLWNLAKVVIFNIFFGHAIATILIAIAKINPEFNWIDIKLIYNGLVMQNPPWYETYIWGYYWACTIMMTVGFGDISPVDYREAIVVSFIQIFSSIVLAYNINEVGSIISAMRKPNALLDKKLGIMRRMMKNNPIPEELQWKIQSYLSHQTQIKQQFQYQEHRQIIMALPQQLRIQYFQQANKSIYQNLPFFRHLQGQTLFKLSIAFQGRVYYPGQYIMKGRQGCNKVIIIRSGTVGLTFFKQASEMNGTVVQKIKIKQDQNLPVLITTNILSRYSLISYDIITLKYTFGLVLSYQKFLAIIKESKLDYSFYMSILDKHQKDICPYEYVKCQYCYNQYHTRFDCTRLHYIPLKSEVIYHQNSKQGKEVERIYRQHQKRNKASFHSYWLRKKFFIPLEKVNSSISKTQQNEDEQAYNFNIDEIYNFPMYFKEWNAQQFKHLSLRKNQRMLKLGLKVLRSLKELKGVIPLDHKFSSQANVLSHSLEQNI